MAAATICFGDVIQLWTKSAHAEGEGGVLGFLEQKSQLLLVVPPVKDELKDKFIEAEFIVSPVRGDKPPANGTPLSYKQPFVLKTSDGSGYALNNKTPNQNDVVSLQLSGIKGEMYVCVDKEGFTSETHVHDGDMNVEISVVDSNRIRKKYNKTLTHYAKPKSDAPGGFVCCGSKGATMTFKVCKLGDRTETRKYIKDPAFRRASQLLVDPVKENEVSEASILETPSRAGSIVAPGPLLSEDSVDSIKSEPASPSNQQAETTAALSAAAAAATPETPEPAAAVGTAEAPAVAPSDVVVEADKAPSTVEVAPVVAPAEEQLVDLSTPANSAEATPQVVLEHGLSTIELSAASMDAEAMDGSVPVHDKLPGPASEAVSIVTTAETVSTPAPSATHVLTMASATDLKGLSEGPDERVDTACVGKCAIM